MLLSQGEWHKLVPREKTANLKWRRAVVDLADEDELFRDLMVRACQEDILFYINTFVWQFNPNKPASDRVAPFVTWDFQEDALLATPETWDGDPKRPRKGILWCYENGQSIAIPKSRKMGASWICLIAEDWVCRFQDYTQALNISRDEDAVDCKSPDSLFWKLRFIDEHLPDWLGGLAVDQTMYLEYERTHSVNTGEASTAEAGVGGRGSWVYIDEVSSIRTAAEIRQRTANTSDFRLFSGTPRGAGTEFYRICKKSPEIATIEMHWTQHPEMRRGMYRWNKQTQQVEVLDKTYQFSDDYPFIKTGLPAGGYAPGLRSPAYDKKCEEIGSARAVALEMDIDWIGSIEQPFDSMMVDELVLEYSRPPLWQGDIRYDVRTGEPFELVERAGGQLRLWCLLDGKGNPPDGNYAAGADIALGTGATPSCLAIADVQQRMKVAEYTYAHIEPKDFGTMAVALCRLFCGARICWEKQGPGDTFGKQVIALDYWNVYWSSDEDAVGQPRNPKMKPGWYPGGGEKKSNLLLDYWDAIRHHRLIDRSAEALQELKLFTFDDRGNMVHNTARNKTDVLSGAGVNHADVVMASALMHKMMKMERKSLGEPDLEAGEQKRQPTIMDLSGRLAEHTRILETAKDGWVTNW